MARSKKAKADSFSSLPFWWGGLRCHGPVLSADQLKKLTTEHTEYEFSKAFRYTKDQVSSTLPAFGFVQNEQVEGGQSFAEWAAEHGINLA